MQKIYCELVRGRQSHANTSVVAAAVVALWCNVPLQQRPVCSSCWYTPARPVRWSDALSCMSPASGVARLG